MKPPNFFQKEIPKTFGTFKNFAILNTIKNTSPSSDSRENYQV